MVFLVKKKFVPTRVVDESKSNTEKEPAVEVYETENVIHSVVETTFIEDEGQEFTLGSLGHDSINGVEEGRSEAESEREDTCSAREEKPRHKTAEDSIATPESEEECVHPHRSSSVALTYPKLAIETVVNDDVTEVLAESPSHEEPISSSNEDKVKARFAKIRRFQSRSFLIKSKSRHAHTQPLTNAQPPTHAQEALRLTFPDLSIEEGGVGKEVEVVPVSKHSVIDDLDKNEDRVNGMSDSRYHSTKKFQPKWFLKLKPKGIHSQSKRTIEYYEGASLPELEVIMNETDTLIDEGTIDDNLAVEKQNLSFVGEARPNGEELSLSESQQSAPQPNEVFEVVLKGTFVGEHLCIDKKQDATPVKRTNTEAENMHTGAVLPPCLRNKAIDVEPEGTVANERVSFKQGEDVRFIERTYSNRSSFVDSEPDQDKLFIADSTEHDSEARSRRENADTPNRNAEMISKENLRDLGTKSASRNDDTARNVIIDSILFNLAKAEVAAKADGDVDAQVKIHLLRAKILRITKTRDKWATKVDGIGDDDKPDEVFLSGPFKRLLSPVLENLEKAINMIDRAILNGTTGVIMSTANLIDHQCIGNVREIAVGDSGSINSIVDSEIQSIFTA